MEATTSIEFESSSPAKSKWGWRAAFIVFFVFFVWLKFPTERLNQWLTSIWKPQLAAQGIELNYSESNIVLGFGISQVFKGVEISGSGIPTLQLEELEVSPSLHRLLLLQGAGTITVKSKKGEAEVFVSKSIVSKESPIQVSADLKDFDLGELGLTSGLGGLKATLPTTGRASIEIPVTTLIGMDGRIDLSLKRIQVPEQSVMGFPVPELLANSGQIQIEFNKSKAVIKKLEIGKKGASDDLYVQASGDLALGKTYAASSLNMTASFGYSEKVGKALSIVEGFLVQAKQPDGSYAYRLTGSPAFPQALPLTDAH